MHGFGARRLFRQAKMSSMAASQSQHGYPTQSSEPWTKLTHTERLQDWFAYNPRTMRPPPLSYDTKCMKILSWNEREVENFKNLAAFYDNSYWSCSVSRLGYSGTAVISRVKPITVQYGLGIHEHDQEGRIITLEFDGFYLSKPVIIAGDLNCARQSIDIHNPPENLRCMGGFTVLELGWRLDYFLVSESIADMVHDSYILPDVSFSDHSPIGLILKL
ncbi:hypothetical protein GUJ93_ZPchr0001g32276 [Zizania palustris]|uniref:Endonuclease/exonuclease/phosphatase domain-containing protein n=1 Tax=Zizania palustris TaxID=103762 RepID=A0A8J5RX57_ZIZPA|nr:hypothetical protein GUJ93_ZPchr0001g32276 [Zizania palustris]